MALCILKFSLKFIANLTVLKNIFEQNILDYFIYFKNRLWYNLSNLSGCVVLQDFTSPTTETAGMNGYQFFQIASVQC